MEISGAVAKPMTLTYADLAKRPQITLKDVVMIRSQGENTTNAWTGPALADMLTEAGISAQAKTLTFVANDGYAMEMTMGDVQNAIIALKRDNEWLDKDGKEPLRMVIPDKAANFWVAQLEEIKVSE